jgi:hypothetical protein
MVNTKLMKSYFAVVAVVSGRLGQTLTQRLQVLLAQTDSPHSVAGQPKDLPQRQANLMNPCTNPSL